MDVPDRFSRLTNDDYLRGLRLKNLVLSGLAATQARVFVPLCTAKLTLNCTITAFKDAILHG